MFFSPSLKWFLGTFLQQNISEAPMKSYFWELFNLIQLYVEYCMTSTTPCTCTIVSANPSNLALFFSPTSTLLIRARPPMKKGKSIISRPSPRISSNLCRLFRHCHGIDGFVLATL
jgi:hypothetical protein